MNLAYLGVKLKKTLGIICEAPSEIYLQQCLKLKIKKSFIAQGKYSVFFAILMLYIQLLLFSSIQQMIFVNCLWVFLFVPTRKSHTKFTAC